MGKIMQFSELVTTVTEHLKSIQDVIQEYEKDHHKGASQSSSEEVRRLVAKVKQIEAESERTKRELEKEKRKSNFDPLTNLPNRTSYNERVFHELRRFRRYHRPLVLAVCDIDLFGQINQQFGHRAGDKVLGIIANVIRKKVRAVDYVARLGEDEFVFIMPETSGKQALAVLEKVRKTLASVPFKFNSNPVRITASFGVTELVADDSLDTVFDRADKALYRAKNDGRNRSCLNVKKAPDNVVKPVFPKLSKPVRASKEISFK